MPILLTQKAAFTGPQIDVMLRATSGSRSYSIPVKIEFKHTALWDATPYKPIVASYMYGTSTPTAFIVAPPKERSQETQPPILSLREYLGCLYAFTDLAHIRGSQTEQVSKSSVNFSNLHHLGTRLAGLLPQRGGQLGHVHSVAYIHIV